MNTSRSRQPARCLSIADTSLVVDICEMRPPQGAHIHSALSVLRPEGKQLHQQPFSGVGVLHEFTLPVLALELVVALNRAPRFSDHVVELAERNSLVDLHQSVRRYALDEPSLSDHSSTTGSASLLNRRSSTRILLIVSAWISQAPRNP